MELTEDQKDILINDALLALKNGMQISPYSVLEMYENHEELVFKKGTCCLVGAVGIAAGCNFPDKRGCSWDYVSKEVIPLVANRLKLDLEETDKLCCITYNWGNFKNVLGTERYDKLQDAIVKHQVFEEENL